MPNRDVDPKTRLLQGATFGERLGDAIKLYGLKKDHVAKRAGMDFPQLQKYLQGKDPLVSTAQRLVAAIRELAPVTADELMGFAVGQDPPYAAWPLFLETAEGRSMTVMERRSLQSYYWGDRDPTVELYKMQLAVLKSAPKRD